MSAPVIDTLDVGEAAFLLRLELGPLRQWGAWLNDCSRGDAGAIYGLTLTPCATQRDSVRAVFRPRYSLKAVRDFIEAVKAATLAARPAAIKTVPLAVDAGTHWRRNRFDAKGGRIKARTIGTSVYR